MNKMKNFISKYFFKIDISLKLCIIGILLFFGCKNYYYIQHSGSIFTAGLTVPEAEHVQIDAVNAIDGCVLKVKEKSEIEHAFEQASSNNYFGVIFTKSWLKSKTNVKPSQPSQTNLIESTSKK